MLEDIMNIANNIGNKEIQSFSKDSFIKTDSVEENQNINNQLEKEIENLKKEDIQEVLDVLNENPMLSKYMKFGFAKDVSMLIIEIRDKASNDLLSQFPSKDFIKRLKYSNDQIALVLDKKI